MESKVYLASRSAEDTAETLRKFVAFINENDLTAKPDAKLRPIN